jgi:hypothetical protein
VLHQGRRAADERRPRSRLGNAACLHGRESSDSSP